MSRHEGNGGRQPDKWAWARRKGLGLTAVGALADGAPSNGSGSKPQTVNLAELGRPMPPGGKVVFAAAGMQSLTELVSRGSRAAIGFREGGGPRQSVAEDPARPFVDLGKNVLGFHELDAALHVTASATELAIGSRVMDGETGVFLPLTTHFKDDGDAGDIAEKHPNVPIMHISPPGSSS